MLAGAGLVALLAPGCGGCGENASKESAPPPKVEAVEGMKYYVGGPISAVDKYGRMRLSGFNGQVSTPTSRGLLVGVKLNPDSTFQYKTWINGVPISESLGFLDDDGLFWYRERFTFDSNGAVMARQTFEYDDEKRVMTSVLEHLDLETGEVLQSTKTELPYTPTASGDDEDILEEGEDDSE